MTTDTKRRLAEFAARHEGFVATELAVILLADEDAGDDKPLPTIRGDDWTVEKKGRVLRALCRWEEERCSVSDVIDTVLDIAAEGEGQCKI